MIVLGERCCRQPALDYALSPALLCRPWSWSKSSCVAEMAEAGQIRRKEGTAAVFLERQSEAEGVESRVPPLPLWPSAAVRFAAYVASPLS